MTTTTLEYAHWGINVCTHENPGDYAPIAIKHFGYPVGARGPVNSAETERQAIEYCHSLGGKAKGPFFK